MKKFIFILAAIFMLLVTVICAPMINGREADEPIDCPYTLVETRTGTVIDGQWVSKRTAQGSLPKLMTVLLAAELYGQPAI